MEPYLTFPEEKVVIIRPSLNAICARCKPAAKLLSVLMEHATQQDNNVIYRNQKDLLDDLCDEMSAKTLQELAIPMLRVFGYLTVEQKDYYVLSVESISQALTRKSAEIVDYPLWLAMQQRFLERCVKRNLHRARKLHLPATLSVSQWQRTVKHFQGKCAYCRERMYEVLEHVIPLSDEESPGTVWSNCVPACYSCNTRDTKLQQTGWVEALAYLEMCKGSEE